MLLELILYGAIGLLLVAVGLLIWKKQKITLIHDYHYRNVRKKDVPAYTRLVGLALVVFGAGIALTGVVNFAFHTQKGLWCFALGGAGFFVLMDRAQKRYNGSWF